MGNATVIWVDLQSAPTKVDLSAQVGLHWRLYKIYEVDKTANLIRALAPRAVFLEYTDPSAELLDPVKRLASDFPESHFVMITQEHSESLAVWALRARIWDYLVKPVDPFYLLSCVGALTDRETETRSTIEEGTEFEQKTAPIRYKDADLSDRLRIGNEHRTKRYENQLTPAMTFVKANYAEKVTLGAVAKLCGLGRYQFSRAFKRAHGRTFREFVIIHRIQKAEQMLCFANVSITDVAFSVGFNDLSHFAEMFRRYVGVRPSEYAQGTKGKMMRMNASRGQPDEAGRNAKLP